MIRPNYSERINFDMVIELYSNPQSTEIQESNSVVPPAAEISDRIESFNHNYAQIIMSSSVVSDDGDINNDSNLDNPNCGYEVGNLSKNVNDFFYLITLLCRLAKLYLTTSLLKLSQTIWLPNHM